MVVVAGGIRSGRQGRAEGVTVGLGSDYDDMATFLFAPLK